VFLLTYIILIIFYVLTDLSIRMLSQEEFSRSHKVESLELKEKPPETHPDADRPQID